MARPFFLRLPGDVLPRRTNIKQLHIFRDTFLYHISNPVALSIDIPRLKPSVFLFFVNFVKYPLAFPPFSCYDIPKEILYILSLFHTISVHFFRTCFHQPFNGTGTAMPIPLLLRSSDMVSAPAGKRKQPKSFLSRTLAVAYFRASRISEASDKTRWGRSSDWSRIASVVSPLRTRMPVIPALRPDFTSV